MSWICESTSRSESAFVPNEEGIERDEAGEEDGSGGRGGGGGTTGSSVRLCLSQSSNNDVYVTPKTKRLSHTQSRLCLLPLFFEQFVFSP